jgi:hypothetical protein
MSLRTDRRTLAKGIAATIAASAVTAGATAAQAQFDEQAVLELSQRLVALNDLEPSYVPDLITHIREADPDGTAFGELQQMPDFSLATLETTPESTRTLARNILQYWYLGRWDGVAVANAADRFFDFSVWHILSYSTVPTLCKGFGYWTQPLETEPEQS